jgi:hypothetical protein
LLLQQTQKIPETQEISGGEIHSKNVSSPDIPKVSRLKQEQQTQKELAFQIRQEIEHKRHMEHQRLEAIEQQRQIEIKRLQDQQNRTQQHNENIIQQKDSEIIQSRERTEEGNFQNSDRNRALLVENQKQNKSFKSEITQSKQHEETCDMTRQITPNQAKNKEQVYDNANKMSSKTTCERREEKTINSQTTFHSATTTHQTKTEEQYEKIDSTFPTSPVAGQERKDIRDTRIEAKDGKQQRLYKSGKEGEPAKLQTKSTQESQVKTPLKRDKSNEIQIQPMINVIYLRSVDDIYHWLDLDFIRFISF